MSNAIHYAPAGRPLCDSEEREVLTANAALVAGCDECEELAAEDLADNNEYRGRCLHCRREVAALGGVAWRRAVRSPCPHCRRAGW